MLPEAIATRSVTFFSDTSTMLAEPLDVTWESFGLDLVAMCLPYIKNCREDIR